MKPIFNNFLGCMSLETGGKVIAWFSIVGGILGLLICVSLAILSGVAIGAISETDPEYDVLQAAAILLMVVFAVFAVYLVVYLVAAFFLLNGIKRRLHKKMMFMLVILAIGVVLDILSIFASSGLAIITNIIGAAIAVYIFLTLFSLYHKIKNENAQGNVTTINNDWSTTK